MADDSVDRAPYHGYQVVVRGRIIELQDLGLEDARLALMTAIDVLEDVEVNADRQSSLVGRWRDGRTTRAGGLGSVA